MHRMIRPITVLQTIGLLTALLLSAAWAQNTDSPAQTPIETAKTAYFNQYIPEAIEAFTALADQGDAQATYYLGLIYADTQCPQADPGRAMGYFLAAADQDYAPAMREVGHLYDTGNGVPRNLLLALDWYRRAEATEQREPWLAQVMHDEGAELIRQPLPALLKTLQTQAEGGDVQAQYRLAITYDLGRLVEADPSQAFKWYGAAAASGHHYAQLMLGYFYCRGIGTAPDSAAAERWFAKSTHHIRCEN